jgi:hypothetical protein
MTPDAIKLRRYRYGDGAPLIEMQDRLQAVAVTKDISGKEDIQLSMLGSFEEPQYAFTPGDFISLQDQTDAAWSWGRVSVVRSTLKRDIAGSLTHAPYAVMVQGWYDFLSRSKVHVMDPAASRTTVGTMFNFGDWQQIGADLKKMYGQPAGLILQYMMRKVARIKLPASLGGGWFSDEIPIVYDRATALRYAPEFEDIEPVSFGSLMPQLSSAFANTRSSDVGSLIANMFLFETSLVELIPYMSTGGQGTLVPTTNPQPTQAETPEGRAEQAQVEYEQRYVGGRTPLGRILGAQPVLVYRIKPFRADPLYLSAVSKIHYRPEDVEVGYLDRELALYDETTRRSLLAARAQARGDTTVKLFDQGMFGQTTFNPPSIVPLPYSYITSVSRQRSDTERLNASSINAVPPAQPGGTTITSIDYLGLPVAIDNQIEEHGLRLRIAKWHMYPEDSEMTSPEVGTYYRAVAAQVMQFYEKAHLYETGSMSLHFTHTQYFVESDRRQQSTYDKAVLGLEPGRWFRTSFKGLNETREPLPLPTPAGAATTPRAPSDEYYGYVTSVTHNIQRMVSGFLTANTQINFMRGHFSEMWEVLNGVNVPLTEADRPPNGGGGQQQRNAGDRSACSRAKAKSSIVLDPSPCAVYPTLAPALKLFRGGASTTLWGTSGNVGGSNNQIAYREVPSARPFWLRCWFLEACSVMSTREYNTVKAKLDEVSNEVGTLRPQASQIANLWALAACAYVIERYWQTHSGYEGVRLRIHNIPGAAEGGYHTLYAAMDFYLEFPAGFTGEQPGAFQMWAALNKLGSAGRIPVGGRGLYLNVNPDTGITGTSPSEAGQASGMGCGYPYGGSSWTHYDIRAAFGIRLAASPSPTPWVATDWNGDGKDEIQLSNSFQPPKERTQNGGALDTEEYVWANVSDPGFKLLGEYINGNKATAAPGVATLMRARQNAPNAEDIEKRRESVRDAAKAYYASRGANDGWMHAVTEAVPNMRQVFELDALVAAQPAPVAPPAAADIQPDNVNDYTTMRAAGEIYLSKDNAQEPVQAGFVMMFGGTSVRGNEAKVYMKEYARPLFGANHVFLAKNDGVSFDYCFKYMLDDEYSWHARNESPPQKRVLYMFSNGTKPGLAYVKAITQYRFDKIYMVDAWLGDNSELSREVTKEFIRDMKARPSTYVFFYTNEWSENGMNAETRLTILGDGTSANRGIGGMERILVTNTAGSTAQLRHLSANAAAVAHLRSSGLMK